MSEEKKHIIEPYEFLIKAYTKDVHTDKPAMTIQLKAIDPLNAVELSARICNRLKEWNFEVEIYIIP